MNALLNFLRNGKLVVATLMLTLAADWLLFGHGAGLGTAMFCLVLWLGLRWNREVEGKRPWALLLPFILSSIQCAIEPSFSNSFVIITLAAYASASWLYGGLGARWRLALEGLFGAIRLPAAVATLRSGVETAVRFTHADAFRSNSVKLLTVLRVIWPALVVALPFLILLGGGNAILQNVITETLNWLGDGITKVRLPSFGRLVFWLLTGTLLLGFLSNKPTSQWLTTLDSKIPEQFRLPSNIQLAAWRTITLLIAVNVIFFVANTADASFLWVNARLPEGVTFSEFVHQGVNRLIACVLLAAVVLGLLFHQAKEVVNTRGVKALAYAWIIQNLFLTCSVVLRLKMYVDAYQLTLLRLYVLCFLVLVAVGFFLLGIKIKRDLGFTWLLNANVLAVFWLFFLMQFMNGGGIVSRVNYRLAQTHPTKLDVDHLATLGPAAWPTLRAVADDPEHFGPSAKRAEIRLHYALRQHLAQPESWQSWQFRKARALLASVEGGL